MLGGFFVILFWGGLFFLVAVGMMVVVMMMMMNGKHICPQEMVIFLFPVIYIFCAANRFFFSFSPTQEVIRVKIATYVGFVVVAVGGRGPCRGLGSSVLNRCRVVRKGIAEMVADASTHAVMYQVEGTRRYTTIRLPTNADFFCFTTFIAYFRVFSPPPKSPLLSTSPTSNSHTNL